VTVAKRGKVNVFESPALKKSVTSHPTCLWYIVKTLTSFFGVMMVVLWETATRPHRGKAKDEEEEEAVRSGDDDE